MTWLFVWFVACPFVTCVVLEYKRLPCSSTDVFGAIILGGLGTAWAILRPSNRK